MKLAIRVTDPGNDAKWNFLFSVFNVASDDQSFLERVVSQRRLSEMIDDALAKSIFDNHYSELFEFYDVKVFLQTDVPESVPRECSSAHTVSLWLILFKRRAKPTWSIQTVRAIF